VANGPNIFQMLLVCKSDKIRFRVKNCGSVRVNRVIRVMVRVREGEWKQGSVEAVPVYPRISGDIYTDRSVCWLIQVYIHRESAPGSDPCMET